MKPNDQKMEPEIEAQETAEVVGIPRPDEVESPECDSGVDDKETVDSPVSEEPIAPPKPPIIGVVTNCDRLNLRAEADSKADVITIIDARSEVIVDMENSTSSFYKVCLPSGIEGFCAKDFITIRQ